MLSILHSLPPSLALSLCVGEHTEVWPYTKLQCSRRNHEEWPGQTKFTEAWPGTQDFDQPLLAALNQHLQGQPGTAKKLRSNMEHSV
jgi:hypothetical protein